MLFTDATFCGIFCFMIEPVFSSGNKAATPAIGETGSDAMVQARLKALLWRATTLAIESSFSSGQDLPVGAAAASSDWIVGRSFASDQRNGYSQMHAEYMTLMDAKMNHMRTGTALPDTVVVTLEPCDNCQDFLATFPSIKTVGFGLPRTAVSNRGLVKAHGETIFQRALRVGLPYEVVVIDDPQLAEAGGIILDFAYRNPQTEAVEIDSSQLQKALSELNAH